MRAGLLSGCVVSVENTIEHIGQIVSLPRAALDLFEAFVEGQWFAKGDVAEDKRNQPGNGGQVGDS